MKILLIQLKVGSNEEPIRERTSHIESLILGNSQHQEADLILLPETSFTAYLQTSREAARRIAVKTEKFIKDWAKDVALRLKTNIAFGYIGLLNGSDEPVNALQVIDHDGEVIYEQSKRFLYTSDLLWTTTTRLREDDVEEFPLCEINCIKSNQKHVRVVFGICNDINAVDFSDAQMNSYPLANAVLKKRAHVVLLAAAWCSAHPSSPAVVHDSVVDPQDQIDYWMERMTPLLGENVYFCSADLVGRENIPKKSCARIHYCGSSCALNLETQSVVAGPLDSENEGVLLVDLEI